MEAVVVKSERTEWDDSHRLRGSLDIPLSDEGVARARSLGEKLGDRPVRSVYSGFTLSAYQTARILCHANGRTAVTRMRELDEVNLGLWQGMLELELKRKHRRAYLRWVRSPEGVAPPMGEPVDRAYRRLVGGFEEILRANRKARVMTVTGPYAWTLLVCYLRDQPLSDFWAVFREPKRWETFQV